MPLPLKKSELEEGETYTAVVDRFSNSGNAIINIVGQNRHVNVGPIDCEQGTRIDFEVTDITSGTMVNAKCRSQNSSPTSSGLLDSMGVDAETLTEITDEQEERDEGGENNYKTPPEKNDLISRRKP
ncbi:hypothetical protein [Halobacterium salinarum]|nr:hypothetical protein [Halobacterium salinarum]QCC44593.1 uncharacterized protein HBSAL_04390 [Halobacterium salinarum]